MLCVRHGPPAAFRKACRQIRRWHFHRSDVVSFRATNPYES
jgi:hypothetical protein